VGTCIWQDRIVLLHGGASSEVGNKTRQSVPAQRETLVTDGYWRTLCKGPGGGAVDAPPDNKKGKKKGGRAELVESLRVLL